MNSLGIVRTTFILGALVCIVAITQLALTWNGIGNMRIQISLLENRENQILLKAKDTQFSVAQVQQWLTDISATRGLDGLNDGFDEAEAYAVIFRTLMQELQVVDKENANLYLDMIPVFETYYATGKRMAEAYVNDGPAGGNILMSEFDVAAAEIVGMPTPFLTQSELRVTELINAQQRNASKLQAISIVVSVVLLSVISMFVLVISRAMRSVLIAAVVANNIANGDLDNRIVVESQDEVGRLLSAMVEMQSRLSRFIEKDIHSVVAAAGKGDLTQRIESNDKNGFFAHATKEINTLVTHCETITEDTVRVFSALAKGDLTQRITREYGGEFLKLKQDANHTVDLLTDILDNDIQALLEKAKEGDLSQRISLDGKQGFFAFLSKNLNDLVSVNEQITDELIMVLDAMSYGELRVSVESEYSGKYQQLKVCTNATIEKLKEVL